MTLHRFFLPATSFIAGRVHFPPEPAHQIRRVLRLRPGETVICLDNTGMEYDTRLDVVAGTVEGEILGIRRNETEPVMRVTLYSGVLKATKLETVLQRCTEIGVSRFVPVLTGRSVAGEAGPPRQRRFETIVREAAEQSGRGCIPTLGETMELGDAISTAAAQGRVIMLWEEEETSYLDEISPAADRGDVSLFVGPEGGFSAGEARQVTEAGGTLATLGPRVLRSETAAIVGCGLLLARRLGRRG